MLIEELPSDVLDALVQYLNAKDLQELSLCSSTYNIGFKEHLWSCVHLPFTELCNYQFTEDEYHSKDSYKVLQHFHNTNVLHLGFRPYQCGDVEKRNFVAN